MTTHEQPAASSSSPSSGTARTRRPERLRRTRTAAAVVAAIIGGVITYLALGNVIPGGGSLLTLAPAHVWAHYGPQIVLASVAAVLLCIPLWRAGRRRVLRSVAVGLAAVALIASTTITGMIVQSAYAAGGSIDLVRAVTMSTSTEGPDDVTSYVTVDGEAQQARIYEPDGGAEGAPVMMFIHGGGWYMGAAADVDNIVRSYATQGFYVISVDYRLADADTATWDTAPADVACALSWTVQRAAAAGADTERLTVLGDSAGGHLSLLLGWSAAEGAAASSCGAQAEVPVPDAVIASYPVGDLTYTYENGAAPLGVDPREFTRFFLGGEPTAFPERLRAVSPATYLSADVPPTLVLQPERDDFIPAEGNYRLVEQAQRAGADVTIARVPFAWHGFDGDPGSIGGQLKTTVVVNWLDGYGLAP